MRRSSSQYPRCATQLVPLGSLPRPTENDSVSQPISNLLSAKFQASSQRHRDAFSLRAYDRDEREDPATHVLGSGTEARVRDISLARVPPSPLAR